MKWGMWKLLDGENFMCLHNVLDNTMKSRMAIGLWNKISSDLILLKQEDIFFQKGISGEHTSTVLLDMIIYVMRLYLALSRALSISGCKGLGLIAKLVSMLMRWVEKG